MTDSDFSHKLMRWLAYAKEQRIRRYDAWPFWFQFMRLIGIEVKPPLFWQAIPLACYYAFVFFISFAFLTQYFTRNFLWNAAGMHWDNIAITFAMSWPLALLMLYNIRLKQRRLKLPPWEQF